MSIRTASDAQLWFRRVLWVGIVANLLLAIPTLIAPEQMIDLSQLPPASPVLWPRFAALLLVLLSILYMPAGIDPERYALTARSAVGARLAGVVFFLGFQSSEYYMLGYVDLVFFVPELALLWMAANLPAVVERETRPLFPPARTIAVVGVLALAAAAFVYVEFFREDPAPFFATDEDHFLFGSIGTEAEQGVPFWIWLVLPRIFP